jgi:hypothetical protein
MNLKGILAIAGKPGLYKMISQTKTGLIVEGLEDKKRFPVYSAHQISSLEEISIYTYDEDMPLVEVFRAMFKHLNGPATISPKAPKEDLLSFFSSIIPNYNEEQVYASDIKKIIQWYTSLYQNGLINNEEENTEPQAAEEVDSATIEETN